MTQAKPESHQSNSSNEAVRERTPIDHVLERLRPLDLPAKEHFENYLRHKWRANHKPKTLEGSFTSVRFFLHVLWSVRQKRHCATPTLRPRGLHRA